MDDPAAWPSRATDTGRPATARDYPEKPYKKAFAPRLGVTYALNPQDALPRGLGDLLRPRVLSRAGAAASSQDGFSSNAAFSSSLGGLQPAFYLQDGFPQDFTPPPFIQSDFRNGQDILYRPLDANERPRSQQWNLTVDREISRGFMVGLAYVGNRATHLPSNNEPLNALDPALLSPGQPALRRVPGGADLAARRAPSRIRAGVSR